MNDHPAIYRPYNILNEYNILGIWLEQQHRPDIATTYQNHQNSMRVKHPWRPAEAILVGADMRLSNLLSLAYLFERFVCMEAEDAVTRSRPFFALPQQRLDTINTGLKTFVEQVAQLRQQAARFYSLVELSQLKKSLSPQSFDEADFSELSKNRAIQSHSQRTELLEKLKEYDCLMRAHADLDVALVSVRRALFDVEQFLGVNKPAEGVTNSLYFFSQKELIPIMRTLCNQLQTDFNEMAAIPSILYNPRPSAGGWRARTSGSDMTPEALRAAIENSGGKVVDFASRKKGR